MTMKPPLLPRVFPDAFAPWVTCVYCKGRGYIVVGTVFGRGMSRETCIACNGNGFTDLPKGLRP